MQNIQNGDGLDTARCNDGRWTQLVTEWIPFDGKRRRWREETVMMARMNWEEHSKVNEML
jgi:hypothetical protein